MYILAVVGEDMMIDTEPLFDTEKQWFISNNNILLNFSIDTGVKLSVHSFLHVIFLNFVTKGGQDDR